MRSSQRPSHLPSSVQSLSHVQLFASPWFQCQASLSITNSGSLLKLMSIRVADAIQPFYPLLSPSPSGFNLSQHQGLFSVSQFFPSGGQSVGISASASVLLINIQSWFPLDIKPLSVASFDFIPFIWGCLFILLVLFFAVQKLLSLIRFYLFTFAFFLLLWETDRRKRCCDSCQRLLINLYWKIFLKRVFCVFL